VDAIKKALAEYQQPHSWWPTALINALQAIDISLCTSLVAGSIRCFLAEAPRERSAAVVAGIERVVAATTKEEVDVLHAEYEDGALGFRDNFLASYKCLLEAKWNLLDGNTIGVRTQTAWAMIFLGDSDYSRRTELRCVVETFLRLVPTGYTGPID
jgi:hypothetical protein